MEKGNDRYQVLILGGGPGGYVAAIRAAQLGLRTALVEGEQIGGSCLNWGCIPSKSIMATARLFSKLGEAEQFGINLPAGANGEIPSINWPKALARAKAVVKKLTDGVTTLLERNRVTVLRGFGTVVDEQTVTVTDGNGAKSTHHSDELIIATGSTYEIPDWAQHMGAMTPKTVWEMNELPESMTVIGGGVIGSELALLFSRLSVPVTLVEKNMDLIPFMDSDLVAALTRQMKKCKVKLVLGTEATGFADGALMTVPSGTGKNGADNRKSPDQFSHAWLFAPRRKASLTGLEKLLDRGLALRNGYILTDARCRTSLPHVYAVGDVNGRFMLAHVASHEGITAAETIAGKGRDITYDMLPYNLYADPELASVGLTEKEAEAKGFVTGVAKFPMSANGKALADGEGDGFVKIVWDKRYGEILGVHIAAHNATDLIGEAVTAMRAEGTIWEVAEALHPHPTMTEAFMEAAFKGLDRPIHIL